MKINRDLLSALKDWKISQCRKPLILKGVRQCGKTWLMKEFGQQCFDDTVYFNFENQEELAGFFEHDIQPDKILFQLGIFAEKQLHPEKTLIIFDEIQACPKALNSLKYFCEQKREYAIVAAGSLLGIALTPSVGFPVGKVDFLELNPCSFSEYLTTFAPQLATYCRELDSVAPLPQPFCLKLESYFREYCAFGGMPEVLSRFAETHDASEAEKILGAILQSYELDFAKHAPVKEIPKLLLLWKSIPEQLAHENAKFLYGEVRSGARAKDLEDALRWLIDAGMANKINRVKTPALPLTAYEDRRCFKLYLNDTGVLRKLAKLPASAVITNPDLWGEFKGRMVENYVQQQFKALGIDPICYWTSSATAEVDFVIQNQDHILPIEVKSGYNLASRSLRVYRSRYAPKLSVRFSLQNLKFDNGLLNVPLYLIGEFPRLLKLIDLLFIK
jgi:predicted AAA+ superfamily ATPase